MVVNIEGHPVESGESVPRIGKRVWESGREVVRGVLCHLFRFMQPIDGGKVP